MIENKLRAMVDRSMINVQRVKVTKFLAYLAWFSRIQRSFFEDVFENMTPDTRNNEGDDKINVPSLFREKK